MGLVRPFHAGARVTMFGSMAPVYVGGLLGSSLDLMETDQANGEYRFGGGMDRGLIDNQGHQFLLPASRVRGKPY